MFGDKNMIQFTDKKLVWIGAGIFIFFIVLSTLLIILTQPKSETYFELEKISKDLRSQISEGNCETYTNFYKEAFEQLGIKTYQVIIPVSAEENNGVIYLEGHTFLIVYNSDGYCKLDQENIECFMYN